MKNDFVESARSAAKNWWISLIIGILFLAMSFWMMANPGATFLALSAFFGILMLVSGIFEIAFAASNSKRMRGWGWYLVLGIMDLLIGAILITHPGLTEIIIPFIIALWLMFRGFSCIGFACDLSEVGVRGWGWYIVLGILAILCSLFIMWNPLAGIFTAVWMAAFAFLFIGIFRIALSIELKRAGKRLDE